MITHLGKVDLLQLTSFDAANPRHISALDEHSTERVALRFYHELSPRICQSLDRLAFSSALFL